MYSQGRAASSESRRTAGLPAHRGEDARRHVRSAVDCTGTHPQLEYPRAERVAPIHAVYHFGIAQSDRSTGSRVGATLNATSPARRIEMNKPSSRSPLRLIGMAWGERYVTEFLEICLPAALAPGNLPVLAEHFDAELVFVTETAMFPLVREHPTWKRASAICKTLLIGMDDLIGTSDSYGMSITYGLFRGFEGLGQAMVDYHLVFLCSDFILADGSYRGLLPHLQRGESLIFSPSYCVLTEEVRPMLLDYRSDDGEVLSVPPRKMADMVIRHRHPFVRAKTVNQRFYSPPAIDQFYWMANETTLLARQFPVALVAMKPERYVPEPEALWDYGLIEEFCPSMKVTALGDSDDYLMLELREIDRVRGVLKPGWPAPAEIAASLKHVVTQYTNTLGRARFTVHSEELPAGLEQAHADLDRFVDEVREHFQKPLPHHLGHIQWTHHYDRFQSTRKRNLEAKRLDARKRASETSRDRRKRAQPPVDDSAGALQPGSGVRKLDLFQKATSEGVVALTRFKQDLELIQQQATKESTVALTALQKKLELVKRAADEFGLAFAEKGRLDAVRLSQLGFRFRNDGFSKAVLRLRESIKEVAAEAADSLPANTSNSVANALKLTADCVDKMLEFEHQRQAWNESFFPQHAHPSSVRKEQRVRSINALSGIGHVSTGYRQIAVELSRSLRYLADAEFHRQQNSVSEMHSLHQQYSMVMFSALESKTPIDLVTRASGFRRLSQILFGSPPNFRLWHSLRACTRTALHATEAAASGKRVLYVHSGLVVFSHLGRIARQVVQVPMGVLRVPGELKVLTGDVGPFDLCVIEGKLPHLLELSQLYEEVRPLIAQGGSMIVFLLNAESAQLPVNDVEFYRDAFPLCGPSRIAYSGSWPSSVAMRIRQRLPSMLSHRLRMPVNLALGLGMFCAAPFALAASLVERSRNMENSFNPPDNISSVTVEIRVG
jgi:hypothetical protein